MYEGVGDRSRFPNEYFRLNQDLQFYKKSIDRFAIVLKISSINIF